MAEQTEEGDQNAFDGTWNCVGIGSCSNCSIRVGLPTQHIRCFAGCRKQHKVVYRE